MRKNRWPSWRDALLSAHAPESESELAPDTEDRQRLAYDELLADQLALSIVRASQRNRPGRAFAGDSHLRDKAIAGLTFKLTASQLTALAEISGDMAAPIRMLRILQARTQSQLGVHLDSPSVDDAPVKVTEEAKQLRDPSGRYQLLGEIGLTAQGHTGLFFAVD